MDERHTYDIYIHNNTYRSSEQNHYSFDSPQIIQSRAKELASSPEKEQVIHKLIINLREQGKDGTEPQRVDINDVIATLFAYKRTEYLQPFNEAKELLAITAVINLLQGNWDTLDTAAGKTQVILPIAALTLSLVGHTAVILPTAQESLVPDLIGNIRALTKQIETAIDNEHRASWQEITHCERLTAESTEPKTARECFEQSITAPYSDELLDRQGKSGLFVTTYNDLTFYAFNHRDMWGKFPPCLGDEISALFDANEVMLQTLSRLAKKAIPFNPENADLMEYTRDYIIQRTLYEVLHTDMQNFEFAEGEMRLSPDGLLVVSKMTKELERYVGIQPEQRATTKITYRSVLQRLEGHTDISREAKITPELHAIRKVMREAVNYFDHTSEAPSVNRVEIKKGIFDNLSRHLRTTVVSDQEKFVAENGLSNLDRSIRATEEYVLSLANDLVKKMNIQQGLDYLDTPRDIRDRYTGEFKLRHQFLTDTTTTLQAVHGEFNPATTDQALLYYIHSPTFLTLILGGKIAATDASMFFTNPRTGERTPSAFVSTVDYLLNKNVIDLSTDVVAVPIPVPEINNTAVLIDRLVTQIRQRSNTPELVVCRNEETADQLVDTLHKTGFQPGSQFEIIHAKTTEEDKKQIFDRLASGALHICITTGPGSLGKNIEDRIAGYPNLHVTEFGMPLSLEQFTQTLRRLRREDKQKSDFSWYIPLEEARQWLTLLQDKPRRAWLVAGAKPTAFAEGLGLITRASQGTLNTTEQDKLTDLMLYLLEERARQRQSDAEHLVNYETLWIRDIAPHITRIKEHLFREHFSGSWLEKLLDARLLTLLSQYDCSTPLRNYIRSTLILPSLQRWFTSFEGQLQMQFISDCENHPQLAYMHYDDKQQPQRNELIKAIWFKRLMEPGADTPPDKRSDKRKAQDAKDIKLQQEVASALNVTYTEEKPTTMLKDMDQLVDNTPVNYFSLWQERLVAEKPDWQSSIEAEEQLSIVLASVEGALETMQSAATRGGISFNTIEAYNNIPTPICQPDLDVYQALAANQIADIRASTQELITFFGMTATPLAHGQKLLFVQTKLTSQETALVTAPSDSPQRFANLSPITLTVDGVTENYFVANQKVFEDEQVALFEAAENTLSPGTTLQTGPKKEMIAYRCGYSQIEKPTTRMLWFYVPKPTDQALVSVAA